MEDLSAYQLNRHILCIDLKCFYASVECVLRGLDPFKTPLVVADRTKGNGAVILAVSPYLRAKGVPSRCRIMDLPKDIDIIYARPQMKTYMEYSLKVMDVYLDFVSENDIYAYSIDECFIDVTAYLSYYKVSADILAKQILDKITKTLGLTATCGIGPNMLLSKLSMDIEAKQRKSLIANWQYTDVAQKLWPITPLSKMWGIGSRMEHKLNQLGFYSIGDIANSNIEILKSHFGILGEELWYHTHGIDMSMVSDKDALRKKPKSFGISQVLSRGYDAKEIQTIMVEMIDDITARLRLARKKAKTVSLIIGYSRDYEIGFSRQTTLLQPTHNETLIYQACLDIFESYDEGLPIQMISIQLSKLDDQATYQYSLFEDSDALEKEYKLRKTLDKVKLKFGKNAVLRATSLQKHATAKQRNNQIGGHHV